MRLRALLALLVLLGMLPVQGGTQASSGRANLGPTVLFLHPDGNGTFNLSPDVPAANASVVLGNNGSVVFTLSNLSALRMASGLDGPLFRLELGLVSLNTSGITVSCALELDYLGNGSAFEGLAFNDYTTGVALEPELAVMENTTPVQRLEDFRSGSVRLNITRTDRLPGLLELICANGGNRSSLSIPYGAPLQADAGPDRAVKVGRTVGFNTSLSGSVDPAATEYLWNFGNGMTGAGSPVETSYGQPGKYNVTLTIRWNGLEASDTAVVDVAANLPPTANAGADVTKPAGVNYTFRGAGSDPDGRVVSFSWTLGDGTVASGQNVTHAFGSPGNFTVILTVRDDDGAEGQDILTMHINFPPRITNITVARSGASWNFAVVAQDPDTQLISNNYQWDFGDGANGTGAQTAHRYNSTGTYAALCTVTDGYGDSDTAAVNVTVSNAPPYITRLGITGSSHAVNEPVRCRPVASDPDGDRLDYYWDFGDGTTSTDQNPTHYYPSAGTYRISLTVSDGTATYKQTATVTITESSLDTGALFGVALPCLAVIVVIVILLVVRAAGQARKRQEQGGQYMTGQYQPYAGVPQAPQPYGAQYPQFGGQYQPYGRQYPAAPAPPRPTRAPGATPGACPRCGSTGLERFPDGHAKCQNCKKIFFTG